MDTAVILAAGQGTKMQPFGRTQAKACLPVANKPLIRRTVETLAELGIKRTIVVTGYLEEQVRHALSGISNVEFFRQPQPEGTAAALRELAEQIDMAAYLLVYGDVLVSASDMRRVIECSNSSAAPLVALVAEYGKEQPQDWLGVTVESDKVTKVIGHARGGTSHRLAGVFAIRQQFQPYIDHTPGYMTALPVGQMPTAEAELAQSIQDALDAAQQVQAVVARDTVVDLDKPWHLMEANHTYLRRAASQLREDYIPASAHISPDAEIHGRLVLGENVVIGPRVRIKGNLWVGDNTIIDNGAIIGQNCCIGSNCRVEHYCLLYDYSVVGDRSIVSHCAELQGMVMERVHLYHYMEFSGIIGRCTDLGAATVCGTLRFDDGTASHSIKGRRETPPIYGNWTYIGDFCRTGVNTTLMPGVKMGPYSIAGPGVMVTEDIPPNTVVLLEQQTQKKTWGPERYGW